MFPIFPTAFINLLLTIHFEYKFTDFSQVCNCPPYSKNIELKFPYESCGRYHHFQACILQEELVELILVHIESTK